MTDKRLLSPEEVDTLLASAAEIDRSTRGRAGGATAYRFVRPDPMSKDAIRALQLLHERFAWNLSTSLSAYLRAVTQVRLVSVEPVTYAEFVSTLPELTAFYACAMPPLDSVAALELNSRIAFSMVDRMLGGRGNETPVERGLTEIELNIIDAVVKIILETLSDAWRPMIETRLQLTGRETRPQMLQVAAPGEMVVHLAFEVNIGENRGFLNLSVPLALATSLRAGVAPSRQRARREPTAAERHKVIETLKRVPTTISALLVAHIPARDLIGLAVGNVISLGHSVEEPVEVRVGGVAKFAGQLVRTPRGAGLTIASRTDSSESEGGQA